MLIRIAELDGKVEPEIIGGAFLRAAVQRSGQAAPERIGGREAVDLGPTGWGGSHPVLCL